MRNRIALVAGLLLALGAFAPNAFAGTARTQTNIDVFVDCVTQGSGSYDATFGYSNDNATAQSVPVGDANYITPPSYNGGQTTSFQPGTHHAAFTVKAIPNTTKLTWTVSLNGHTDSVTVSSSSSHACAPTTKVIHVAVDCVTKGATTYDATFAYNNDNATAQTVPVGNDNYLTPPSFNGTQTTTFQPGTVHNAFTVKGVPNGTKLTWRVNSGGHSDTATASSSGHACAPTTKVIHVAVDCVTKGATTYDATFAYNNDNATAQTVPVGNDNYLTPPSFNGTQTTTFQPGTHHAAFTIKGIPNATKLTWNLTFGGSTRSTTASSSDRSCTPPSTTRVIHVSVDCVTKGATTYDATFAYNNDNATAQTVPVGNDNYLTPPSFNGTQTTTFQPGTVHNAFTVKGVPNGTKLTWRVNSGGHSDTATASSSGHACAPTTKVIHVAVDCVTKGATTYDATFAYNNDNATAQTVPVGNDNYLTPPSFNGTQTTTFQPGTHHAAFTIKGIPSGTKLTWTLNSGGRSDTATASESSRRCVSATPPPKVTICHRTNSSKRPWVQITVSQRTAAWYLRHGDVMPSSTGSCPAPRKKHHKHGSGNQSSNQVHQEKRR